MSGISKRVSGSWVSGDYGIMKTSTDTITTLPAVLYPNDTTATVGLKGNMEQNGTPSPQNPIQPSECGERTGNLFDKTAITAGYALSANGTIGENANFGITGYIPVTGGADYKLYNLVTLQDYFTIRVHAYNGTTWIGQAYEQVIANRIATNSETFTVPNNATSLRLSIGIVNRQNLDILMLSDNLNLTSYQPYGYKIPISSANITTPVYLGEVQTTRRIKKLVLTGEENWNLWSSGQPDVEIYYFRWYEKTPSNYGLICTHLPFTVGDGNYEHIRLGGNNREDFVIFISKAIASTVADFKSYLAAQYAAGTPVTVWYVLAAETTGIVNEPLMRIGDYADTLSNISIPVTAGGDTLSIGTTLQPSEVTVNYKGWHPIQNVHERDNGAWTE